MLTGACAWAGTARTTARTARVRAARDLRMGCLLFSVWEDRRTARSLVTSLEGRPGPPARGADSLRDHGRERPPQPAHPPGGDTPGRPEESPRTQSRHAAGAGLGAGNA